MKKLFLSTIVLVLGFLSFALQGETHPGNTAADGCHYCRTNCSSWGVAWYERHCHGGASSYSSYESPSEKCARKYPGTIYSYFGDRCVCSNGAEYDNTQKECPDPEAIKQERNLQCAAKYPGTTYQANGDKCVCPKGEAFDPDVNSCPSLLSAEELQRKKVEQENERTAQCAAKYPGTIYREEGDRCVCANGKAYDEKKRQCPADSPEEEKKTNDQKCDVKYPGTIYQASGDKCVCPNGKPFHEQTWQCPA